MYKTIYYKGYEFDIEASILDKYIKEVRGVSKNDLIDYLICTFQIDLNDEKEVVEEKLTNAMLEEIEVSAIFTRLKIYNSMNNK